MVKKALMLLGVLAIVGVAGLSLLLPDAVNASEHSATRSFSTNPVITGAELEVEISVSGLGAFGQVQETLPEGFSFGRSDQASTTDGQNVTFTLLGEESFTYTVTASSMAGSYQFSGTVSDSDRDSRDTTGDSSIDVIDPPLGAQRSISRSSVSSGEQITVSIDASGFGSAASVEESLPAGFSYVSSSLSSAAVNVSDDSIRFTLLDEDSFSYTLTAGAPGDYTISGTISGFDRATEAITGDDSVSVVASAEAAASRSFGAAFADPEGEIAVSIAASGYGAAAQIVETIPDGFTYVGTDLPGGALDTSGQAVTFVLLGESSFSYTVAAPAETGAYAFSGTLTDIDQAESAVGGAADLHVGNPGIVIDDSGVREINENTPGGVRIGDPINASSAVSALTFEITSAAADTFDIENDGQLRTKGDLDYETRSSYSLQVTISDEYGVSESLVVTIKVLDRDEYVPPTATPVPTPTAAPTQVPPTATSVPVPPTVAPTQVPPTATSVPAEPTATPEPEEPEDEGGFPVWAIIIIVIAAVVVVGGGGYFVYRRQMG